VIGAVFVSNKEEMIMYIVVTGSPHTGFAVVGPYASEKAAGDAGDWALIEYGGWSQNDWLVFELSAFFEDGDPIEGVDAAGTAVVLAGPIGDPWRFFGPFRDLNAAEWWAFREVGFSDYAIALQPVEELETA
jgi:hypothetical protein